MSLATSSLPPLTTIPDGKFSSFAAAATGVASLPVVSADYSGPVASLLPQLPIIGTNRSSSMLVDESQRPRRSTSEDYRGSKRGGWSRGAKSEKDIQRTKNYAFTTQQMERLNAAAKSRELRQQQLIGASRRRMGEKSDSSSNGSFGSSAVGLKSSRASFSSTSSCPGGICAGIKNAVGDGTSNGSHLRHSDGIHGSNLMKMSHPNRMESLRFQNATAPDSGRTGLTRPDEKRFSVIAVVPRSETDGSFGTDDRKRESGDNPADDEKGEEDDCKVGIALPSTRKRGRGRKYDDYDTDDDLIESMYDSFDYHDKDDFHSLPSRAIRSMANMGDFCSPSLAKQARNEIRDAASVSIPPPSSSAPIPQHSPNSSKQKATIPKSIVALTATTALSASSSGYSHPLTLANANLDKKSPIENSSRDTDNKLHEAETTKRSESFESAGDDKPDASESGAKSTVGVKSTLEPLSPRCKQDEKPPTPEKGTPSDESPNAHQPREKSTVGMKITSEPLSPRFKNETPTAPEKGNPSDESSDKDYCTIGKIEGFTSPCTEGPTPRKRKTSEESRTSFCGSSTARNASSRRLLAIHDKLNLESEVLLRDASVRSDSSLVASDRDDSLRLRRSRSRRRRSSRRRNTTRAPYFRASAPGAVQVSGRAFGFDPSVQLHRSMRAHGRTQLAGSGGDGDGVSESNDPFDAESSASASTIQHPPIEATTVVDIEQPPVCVKVEAMHNAGKAVQQVKTVVFCFALVAIAGASTIVALFLSGTFGSGGSKHPDETVWGSLDLSPPTAAPTATAPTSDFELLKSTLGLFSSIEELETVGTPQNCAMRWLLRRDRHGSDRLGPNLKQRYALLALYYATNNVDCTETTRQKSDAALDIDSTTHECMWGNAVECENRGERAVVVSLDLSRSDLNGTLPPEIGLFTDLESLCLRENKLHGQIPNEIGLLTHLGNLELDDNRFHGTIPSTIVNIKTLDDLSLSSNSITGTIPDEVYSLTELRTLDLSNNMLSGKLSDKLLNLKHLSRLSVISNHLTGTLPPALALLSNLAFVHCDNNNFNGTLYNAIGVSTYRQEYTVSNNELTGTIPGLTQLNEFFEAILKVSRLRKVDFSGNHLQGDIGASLPWMAVLQHVDLSRNRLTGRIDHGKVDAPNLELLNYSANELSGPLPEFINAPKLKFIDVHSNKFTGTIPASWGQAEKIEHLDLSHNMLQGSLLPFANYSRLEHAGLRGCNFTGNLPNFLSEMTRLQHLDVGRNGFSGPIPSNFGGLFFLGELQLDGNDFSGTIPTTLGKLEELRALSLESNELVGTIPSELTSLSNLERLDLGNNHFVGSVPSGVCSLKKTGKLRIIHVDKEIECACECNTTKVLRDESSSRKYLIPRKKNLSGQLFHFHGE